jgi:hypothetical protein
LGHAQQASELAEQLHEMRGILVEELERGIPEPESSMTVTETPKAASESAASLSSSGGSTTASKYQQMLAKARTAKAAGKILHDE